MTIHEKIKMARTTCILKVPFLAGLVMYLNVREETNLPFPTMATDGKSIFYHPEFLESNNQHEVNYVFGHEIIHCVLKHVLRGKGKHNKVWNIAIDIVTNRTMDELSDQIYKKRGKHYFKRPQKGVFDNKGIYKDMSSEEIYSKLLKDYNDNPDEFLNNLANDLGLKLNPNNGDSLDMDYHGKFGENMTEQEMKKLEKEWDRHLISASQNHKKMYGSLPGSVEEFLGQLLDPLIDWRTALAEFVEFEKFDFSYESPDTRFSWYPYVLPDFAEEQEKMEDLHISIDISGSVSKKEMIEFITELVAILSQFPRIKGKLYFVNTDIVKTIKLEDLDVNDLQTVPMGGGTDFRPLFKEIQNNPENENPKIIYMTDAYGPFPKNVDIPTMWIVNNPSGAKQIPFGKISQINFDTKEVV